jgi:hypothetical protein
MKCFLVFSDKAPDGIVCRLVDLKHWVDASSIVVEVEPGMEIAVQECIDGILPVGLMNVGLKTLKELSK